MTYAGFWRRCVAALIDSLILILPMYALNVAIPYAGSLLLAIFYYPIFESSTIQATPGKYIMGLKILRENGESLTFPRALARMFLKYVSMALLFIGYLIQPFTEKRQTLHDIIAESVVIKDNFLTVPDWVQAWMKQVRYVFRIDDTNPSQTTVNATYSSDATNHTTRSAGVDAATAATGQSTGAVSAIEKLYELYKGGALTEEEFQSKKSELLKLV